MPDPRLSTHRKRRLPLAEPVLVAKTDRPPRTTTEASAAADRAATTPQGATASRPGSTPNSRKCYKLTLWVSATSEDGLADAHGLLQLEGADPIPFCQLRGVQNPRSSAPGSVPRRPTPPRETAPDERADRCRYTNSACYTHPPSCCPAACDGHNSDITNALTDVCSDRG
jgi:hypothetical protein